MTAITLSDGTKATRLIGACWAKTAPASDLEVGHHVVWNFGYIEEVLAIEPAKSGKSIVVTYRSTSGYVGTRRHQPTTQLAIVEKGA